METHTAEITLRDLLAWEPRLEVISPRAATPASPGPLDGEVDWVLTARASPPMLPHLRGGELIILPRRVAQETGVPFQRLVNEITMQPVAGVLTDEPAERIPDSPLVILRATTIGPDLESDLNRLLTTQRGDLLRTTADVDRIIAESSVRGARPGELIHTLAGRLNLPISILNDLGAVLFATGPGVANVPAARRDPQSWLNVPLRAGRTVWLGPLEPSTHALARMVLGRVRNGIQRALDEDASTAPHGSARTAALNALLQPPPGTTRDLIAEQAFRAGIAPGRLLRVVITQAGETEAVLRRRLAPMGDVLDAGALDGHTALIAVAAPSTTADPVIMTQAEMRWMAISAPVGSARDLPEAARQARYIAALIDHSLIAGPLVRFTDDVRLGMYRLLYDHWGTPALERYVEHLLGDLRREDRRGILLHTLRMFLENGGSQRPTAETLGIHRNTLGYRLRQIRSVLSADLDDPHLRLSLQLALVAGELPPPPAQ
jgi:PucR family transcriptional regulator, purine catabolism regulatory protein